MNTGMHGFVYLLVCVTFISCSPVTHNSDIYRDILTNYTKEVRPVSSTSPTMTIAVSGYVMAINGFDAITGTLSLVMLLTLSWKDERLTWNPHNYGSIGSVTIPQSRIWVPDLYNVKVANSFYPIVAGDFRVLIAYNGNILLNPGGIVAVKCSPDVSKFPFDIQRCYMQIFPWMYGNDAIVLVSQSTALHLEFYESNGEWEVLETSARVEIIAAFSSVVFSIKIKRIPLYHIVNTLVPVYFLGFLNPLVFILPCDSGERSGYSLTMLLSYTVFMMIINASLPQTSDPMAALSFVTFGALVCSGLIAVLNNFQLRMYHKDDNVPVPKWLARFVTCLSCARKTRIKPNVVGEDDENVDTGSYKNDQSLPWKTVVNVLDMFYLCLLYACFSIATIMATVYVSST